MRTPFIFMLLGACGGASPTVAAPEPTPHVQPLQPDFVPPEKLDEINSTFNMKRPIAARCYSDAVRLSPLFKTAEGRISLALEITADGKPENVRVTESSLKSEVVERCVIDAVANWHLPAPGQKIDFSFSYDFEPE